MKTKTMIRLLVITALALCIMGCPTGSSPITKKVTVPAITEVTDPFDFTQTYTPEGGWDSNFADGSITYRLTFNGTTSPDGTTSISAGGRPDGTLLSLTQTFYYNSKAVGSRSVRVSISGGEFIAMAHATENAPGTLEALTLTLTK